MAIQENSGYLLRTLHGPLESFEKEYYDLIRSAFLKYKLVDESLRICRKKLTYFKQLSGADRQHGWGIRRLS